MKVRIVAGKFGGRIIDGSGTSRTHPTGERIKNALFNSISQHLEGAVVLDAFAGSGALGLEAISRGAKTAVLVEKDRVAQRIISKNIELLGVENEVKLVASPVASWLAEQPNEPTYDIIFADPPYHDPQLSTALKLIGLLKPNGLMILSYPGRGEVPTELGVVVVDNRSYGDAALAYYRRKDA